MFFCIFYQVNNLFLHQSYLKSPLPVKLTKVNLVKYAKNHFLLVPSSENCMHFSQVSLQGRHLLLSRGRPRASVRPAAAPAAGRRWHVHLQQGGPVPPQQHDAAVRQRRRRRQDTPRQVGDPILLWPGGPVQRRLRQGGHHGGVLPAAAPAEAAAAAAAAAAGPAPSSVHTQAAKDLAQVQRGRAEQGHAAAASAAGLRPRGALQPGRAGCRSDYVDGVICQQWARWAVWTSVAWQMSAGAHTPGYWTAACIGWSCRVARRCDESWALAVFSVKKVVFNIQPQVPSSENSLLLGKDC